MRQTLRGWHESVGGMVRRTLEAAFEDNIPFLASAISFDVILTAIPFFVVLLAVVGYLVQHQLTVHQLDVETIVRRFMPMPLSGEDLEAVRRVEDSLVQIVAHRGRLTLVGGPLFLFFSTRLFGGLRAALNEVFDTDEVRPWPLAKLIDLATMLLTVTLLLLSAVLPALEARTYEHLGGRFLVEWLYRTSLEVVSFGFSTVLFLIIFKVLPSRRIVWRTAFVAATFCAVGFEVTKRLFALYVTSFVTLDRVTSDANVGAFFLFLIWIYYTAYLFLLGGEVAEAYDLVRMRRTQRARLG
ncbi:MAG TPA: YihY/virulence factor BrkB family protein [Gemmatimonadales bacterium]|nr:YihY/virulence factor BrkB family protein [Gemmatimonadales bacterium]